MCSSPWTLKDINEVSNNGHFCTYRRRVSSAKVNYSSVGEAENKQRNAV